MPRLPSAPRGKGGIWGISLVKNELDVIEASILHHLEQGVDAMLIADNGSDDGTLDLLHEMARQYPVHVATDGLKAHEQAAKTSLLATAVARAGASWVVPFDADEFWFARDRTLGEHLVMSTAAVELATTFDVLPVQDQQQYFFGVIKITGIMPGTNSIPVQQHIHPERKNRMHSACSI